jgi:hypothetical protein
MCANFSYVLSQFSPENNENRAKRKRHINHENEKKYSMPLNSNTVIYFMLCADII